MTRREYKPEGIMGRFLGKAIWDMCELLDEKIEYNSIEGEILRKGLVRNSILDVAIGLIGGLIIGFMIGTLL